MTPARPPITLHLRRLGEMNPCAVSLAAILISGSVLRVLPVWYGLPFLYHTDETPIIFDLGKFLWGLKRGYVFMETSTFYYPLAALFDGYFLVGRALGWFASLADFERAFLLTDSTFYLLGRLLAASFSVATIGLTYVLGRNVYGKPVGLIASLLMAVSVIDISISHWVKLDSTVTFFDVLSVILMMKIVHGGTLRPSGLVGLAVGAAIATRIDAVVLVPLLAIAHLPGEGSVRERIQGLLDRGLVVALGATCISYLIISFNLLHFVAQTMLGQRSPFPNSGFGRRLLLFFGFGDVWLSVSHNSLFYARHVLLVSFGFVVMIFVVVGLLRCSLSRSREEVVLLGFLILYSLPLLVFNVFGTHEALPLVPFLMVVAGSGIVTVGRWLERGPSWRWVAVFTFLAVAVPAYRSAGYAAYLASNVDTRTRARQWIHTHIPFGERVAVQKHHELPALLPALDETRGKIEAKLAIARARGLGTGLALEAKLGRYSAETYSIVNLSAETHWGPDGSQLESDYDFDGLLARRVRYVITCGCNNLSGISEDRSPIGVIVAPRFQNVQALERYARFMKRLRTEGQLVAEFVPRNPGIARLTDSPVDPTIRIYRLP